MLVGHGVELVVDRLASGLTGRVTIAMFSAPG